MPSISNLIRGLGCTQGAGPNFYLPADHPHVHIGVDNAATNVGTLEDVRSHIQFISLSFGDGVNTVNLYRRDADGALESRVYDIGKKSRFEAALHNKIGIAVAMDIQLMLNRLTGMGIDL